MSEMKIGEHSTVTLHFAMHLEDGSVADSTKVNHLPGTVVIGDGTLTPGFEAHLMGLKVGDQKSFTVGPEDAFGQANPENVFVLPQGKFPQDLSLQPGVIVEFEQPNGAKQPGVIRDVDECGVSVDFNHPLAGQTIRFDVEIVAIT